MAHKDFSVEKQSTTHDMSQTQTPHQDSESVSITNQSLVEKIAAEMRDNGLDAVSLPIGSTSIETEQTYSQMFASDPKIVTNKGIIRLNGRRIDCVQLLQRG